VRLAGWIACVVLVASAEAGPLKKRRPNEKLPIAVMKLFVEALVLDRRGELSMAAEEYKAANRIEEHADTYYNLAELYLRGEVPQYAVEALAKYLELAPNAPDKKQIEHLIRKLQTDDPTVVLTGDSGEKPDEPLAVILVDGVIVGRSPATVKLTPGRHHVERITATTYLGVPYVAKAGANDHRRLPNSLAGAGNVVIAMPGHNAEWRNGTHTLETNRRLTLPKGRYTIDMRDANVKVCEPFELEVKNERELTHVYLEVGDVISGPYCRPTRKLRIQTVKLP
jgi:tetratricopeptide (TPR) repeat protein